LAKQVTNEEKQLLLAKSALFKKKSASGMTEAEHFDQLMEDARNRKIAAAIGKKRAASCDISNENDMVQAKRQQQCIAKPDDSNVEEESPKLKPTSDILKIIPAHEEEYDSHDWNNSCISQESQVSEDLSKY